MSETSKVIRVMLVDDHDMVRRGLAVFLEAFDDLHLVGEAASGEEAIQICRQLKPDVVLMDVIMPEMDGIETTRALLQECPGVRVIALTSFNDEGMVPSALQAGAISFLFKDVSIDDLANAIRAAYNGRSTLSPEATQVLISMAKRPSPPGQNLTRREREILSLMVKGLTNPAIANQLGVSRSTIKTHVSHILTKLEVSNRLEAVSIAIEHKLIPI
jgi:two-component system, NarL family, response regulator LiaR